MFTLPKNSYFLIPSHPLPHTDQLPISQPSLLPYFIKKLTRFTIQETFLFLLLNDHSLWNIRPN